LYRSGDGAAWRFRHVLFGAERDADPFFVLLPADADWVRADDLAVDLLAGVLAGAAFFLTGSAPLAALQSKTRNAAAIANGITLRIQSPDFIKDRTCSEAGPGCLWKTHEAAGLPGRSRLLLSCSSSYCGLFGNVPARNAEVQSLPRPLLMTRNATASPAFKVALTFIRSSVLLIG
jgi:hypothetical protein